MDPPSLLTLTSLPIPLPAPPRNGKSAPWALPTYRVWDNGVEVS